MSLSILVAEVILQPDGKLTVLVHLGGREFQLERLDPIPGHPNTWGSAERADQLAQEEGAE